MSDNREGRTSSFVQYSQCWEDADILLEAMRVSPGGRYVSIASGGENSFSILSRGGSVTAVDISLPQLAITDIKRVAYLNMDYDDFLEFIGVRASDHRLRNYRGLRQQLDPKHRAWFDAHGSVIENGVIHSGKFESYFASFRKKALPLIYKKDTIDTLLHGNPDREQRLEFYEKRLNTLRYRLLFRAYFSHLYMSKLGRDVTSVSTEESRAIKEIISRVRTGLIEVDGCENPHLHYIINGNFSHVLPHSLRRENFDTIKSNIDKLTLVWAPLQTALKELPPASVDGFNLSDIFERMAAPQINSIYERLLRTAASGARICYWNLLTPKHADDELFGNQIFSCGDEAAKLFKMDKVFFYNSFIIEEKHGAQ